MQFFNLVPFLVASFALVDSSYALHKKHGMQTVQRRDFDIKKCTMDLADRMWAKPHPPDTKAVVCFRSKLDHHVTDAKQFKLAGLHICGEDQGVNFDNDDVFACFFMMGENAFTLDHDAGYQNIAMKSLTGKCSWTGGDVRTLHCHA